MADGNINGNFPFIQTINVLSASTTLEAGERKNVITSYSLPLGYKPIGIIGYDVSYGGDYKIIPYVLKVTDTEVRASLYNVESTSKTIRVSTDVLCILTGQ